MNLHLPRLALLAAGLLPGLAQSANWVKIPVLSIEGSSYFIDTQSLLKSGRFVRVWERLVLDKPRAEPVLGTFQTSEFYMAYDCRQQAAALLESKFYEDATARKPFAHRIRSSAKYMYSAPDSPAAMKLDMVCHWRNPR